MELKKGKEYKHTHYPSYAHGSKVVEIVIVIEVKEDTCRVSSKGSECVNEISKDSLSEIFY